MRSTISTKSSSRRTMLGDVELNITSMMDIFTILLVFLLKSYSVTEVVITPPRDVALPVSTSQIDPKLSIDITISNTSIVFDGKPVVPIVNGRIDQSYYKDGLLDPLLIALQNKLKTFDYIDQMRAQTSKVGQGEEGEEDDDSQERSILIMAHKGLEFRLIEDVLYTAAGAGVTKFRFAVQKLDE